MSMTSPSPVISKGDRGALYLFVTVGAAIVITTAVATVLRIVELLGSGTKQVEIAVESLHTELPYPGGALPITVDSGVISVTELPVASTAAGVLAPILFLLVVTCLVFCLAALSLSAMRGTIFTRRNSRLVTITGGVCMLGFPLAQLCETMLSNGAVAWATGRALDTVVFSFNPATYVLFAFAVATISTVFIVGERMQRDQEGLI